MGFWEKKLFSEGSKAPFQRWVNDETPPGKKKKEVQQAQLVNLAAGDQSLNPQEAHQPISNTNMERVLVKVAKNLNSKQPSPRPRKGPSTCQLISSPLIKPSSKRVSRMWVQELTQLQPVLNGCWLFVGEKIICLISPTLISSLEIEGSVEGVKDRNVFVVDATLPYLDVEVFFVVDPIPLSSCPPSTLKTPTGAKSSAWVLQKLKEISHCMGVLCESLERQFFDSLTAVEVCYSKSELGSSSKLGNKENRVKKVVLLYQL